ncbi:hypothetical protein MKX01_008388 [Papaver californicum]|nr:hypothetical protein MKX01_008388 [Papaver californicum]
MLYWRFSSGTTSLKNGGGSETKNTLIRDDKLRSACERLEQPAEEAKQLRDECNAIFALERAFPFDQVIWFGFILTIFNQIGDQAETILKRRKDIKYKESQLSARLTKEQELQLPT